MAVKGIRQNKYSKEFKESAVKVALASEFKTFKEISEQLGIPESTLTTWFYKYTSFKSKKNKQKQNCVVIDKTSLDLNLVRNFITRAPIKL